MARSTRCSRSSAERSAFLKEGWGGGGRLSCAGRSRRRRATKPAAGPDQPAPDESATAAAEDAPKEDMAHVSRDLLSSSPDIFAPKWTDEPATAPAPEAAVEPVAGDAASEPVESAATPVDTPVETSVEAEPALAPPVSTTPPPPHYVVPTVRPMGARSGGSSMALGIVLVVVGLFALGVVVFGVDLTQYGWPLFVIIPGLTLLVVGFIGGGVGASGPGGIVTVVGLLLPYQSSSAAWASGRFAW